MTPHEQILDYWFGSTDAHAEPSPAQRALWFGKADTTDQTIRERFAEPLAQAAAGAFDDWTLAPAPHLALVVLLDQFPRNMYRDSAGMFAHDEQALRTCLLGLERGHDQKVGLAQRTFLYLPLMHSEQLEHQDHCIRRFEQLVAGAPAGFADAADQGLKFAHLHRDIIVRFGRFPHRNALLGRESSDAERAFLSQPNSSF